MAPRIQYSRDFGRGVVTALSYYLLEDVLNYTPRTAPRSPLPVNPVSSLHRNIGAGEIPNR